MKRSVSFVLCVALGSVSAPVCASDIQNPVNPDHSNILANSNSLPNSNSIPLSFLNYSDGNDWTRYEIAPDYSQRLGWSIRGTLGSYVTSQTAIGLSAEYGQDKREYLTNAGIQLNKEVSFIGSIGMLEEHQVYTAGDGKQTVQQMEYGASLKGAYSIGMLHGFELNGYLADASSKSNSVETGKLYGTQLLTNIFLTDMTRLKIGGGYEWLRWAGGEHDKTVSFRIDGNQRITSHLSLNTNVKLGASEDVYGGGLTYNLGNSTNTNTIGIHYNYIDGKNGVLNDQRVELIWSTGFGIDPNVQPAKLNAENSNKSLNRTGESASTPPNNLLADVMKRPEFLPKQVLARAKSGGTSCSFEAVPYYGDQGQPSGTFVYDYPGGGQHQSYVTLQVSTLSSSEPNATLQIDGNTFSQGGSSATSNGDGTYNINFWDGGQNLTFTDGASYTIVYEGCSASITSWDYLANYTN